MPDREASPAGLDEIDHRRKERQVSRLQIVEREPLPQVMLARYYAATRGRFLSVDPGGDTDVLDPQSWNKFSYTRNNPVKYIDPDGRATTAAIPISKQQFARNAEIRQVASSSLSKIPVVGQALAKLVDVAASLVMPTEQEFQSAAPMMAIGVAGAMEVGEGALASGMSKTAGEMGEELSGQLGKNSVAFETPTESGSTT